MSKYKKIQGNIDGANAVKQAAQALDLAGLIASEVKDSDTLLAVSKLWMDLVEVQSRAFEGPEREAVVHQIGFVANTMEEDNERIERATDSIS